MKTLRLWFAAICSLPLILVPDSIAAQTLNLAVTPSINEYQLEFADRLSKDETLGALGIVVEPVLVERGAIVGDGWADSFDMLVSDLFREIRVFSAQDRSDKRRSDVVYSSLLLSPFFSADISHQRRLQNSVVADLATAELGTTRVFPLRLFAGPQLGIITREPIGSMRDVAGLKLGVFDEMSVLALEAAGASPSRIRVADIEPSLSRGAIDGIETPVTVASIAPYYRALRGGWLFPHYRRITGVVSASADRWNRLEPATQKALLSAIGRAVEASYGAAEERTVSNINDVRETLGLRITETQINAEGLSEGGRSAIQLLFGEDGTRALQTVEDVLLDNRSERSRQDSGEAADLRSPRVFYVTDRFRFPSARLADRYGGRMGEGGVIEINCGEYEIDSAPTGLGVYDAELKERNPRAIRTIESCADLVTGHGPHLLLYIHGYNNGFESASRRLLSLARDLRMPDVPMVMWTWPSQGIPAAYGYDEEAVFESAPELRKFVKTILKRGNTESILVLSHSMGGRLADDLLYDQGDSLEAGSVFAFVAPDVPRDRFLRRTMNVDPTVVLYASDKDLALIPSSALHRFVRAGQGGNNLAVQTGLESVDLSDLADDVSLAQHSHAFDEPRAFADLKLLLSTRQDAVARKLKQHPSPAGPYYTLPEQSEVN